MWCPLHCHIRTSRWDWKDNNWPVHYLKSISANNIHSIFTEPKVTKSHMIQSSHLHLFAQTGEMLQSLDNFNNMRRRFINQVRLYFIRKAYLTYIYIPGNVQTFQNRSLSQGELQVRLNLVQMGVRKFRKSRKRTREHTSQRSCKLCCGNILRNISVSAFPICSAYA